jgi:DNA ligase (NAD+)
MKKKNEFFEGLNSALKEGVEALKNNENLTQRTVNHFSIEELEKIIITLDTLYEKGEQCINPISCEETTDNEYDKLKKELFDRCPESKIFDSVTASTFKSSKNKIIHDPPMTSINKCNGSEKEKEEILLKWFKDCQKLVNSKKPIFETSCHGARPYLGFELAGEKIIIEQTAYRIDFSMSYKHDGLALSCEYDKGELKKVGLRSKSGMDGIDVTEKAKYIDGIPQSLKEPITCKVRGEVETPIPVFEKINKILPEKDKKTNPRAYTAGNMNQKIAERIKNKGLIFTAYSVVGINNPPYETEIMRAEWVSKLGFRFVKTIPFDYRILKTFENDHRNLDFMVDGVVISINNLELQKNMGNSGNKITGNLKGKIAFKFKDEVKNAIVKDIIWQTGRTGNITPILIFDGIQLEGTTVSKCTAHNLSIIKNNKIGIGSTIEIIKSGKIIPKIHKIIETKGDSNIPEICPSCGSNVKIKNKHGSESLICTNNSSLCPAQNIQSFDHYLKRIGVKGIADSTINKLCESGLISEISDFYKLKLDQITSIGFRERSAILILARIRMINSPEQEKDNSILLNLLNKIKDKKIPIKIETFISSLGIDGAGREFGRIIANKYKNLEEIRNLSKEELENIEGVGPITANNVYNYFKDNYKKINNLLEYVELKNMETYGKLDGKKFCLSGKLELGKKLWEKRIEEKGGVVQSSVTKDTSYLICGEGSGAKTQKAIEKNIPILNTEELEDLLNG